MFSLSRIAIFFWMVFAHVAHASQFFGHEVGNGGDVIACGDQPHAVLDYFLYERSPGAVAIELGPGDELTKVKFVLNRLKAVDPVRANRYLERLQKIWPDDVTWVSGFELMDLPDAGYVPTLNCRLRQAVIQRQQRHPALRLLTIQSDIWQSLDAKARAGLILHELIYEEMLALGQSNSKNVRAFNAYISSQSIQTLSAQEYQAIVQRYFSIPDSISFKLDRYTYYLLAGQPLAISLPSLIATTEPALHWELFGIFPEWITIDHGHLLNMTPPSEAFGVYTLDISASGAFYSAAAPVQILVLKDGNYPPTWLVPGITAVRTSEMRTLDIAPLAVDLEADRLRFSKISGPEWVEITSDGKMSYLAPEGESDNFTAWIAVSDDHFRSLIEIRF